MPSPKICATRGANDKAPTDSVGAFDSHGSPYVTVCEPARGGSNLRSTSGSYMSPRMATLAPLWPPTATNWSKSPSGPKGAFENGNIGTLKRWAPPSRVVNSVPPCNPARIPKTPRVVELLRKAIEWKVLLDSGQIVSQADVARKEGITRARVTQVLGLLRLAPEIQQQLLSMPDTTHQPFITERVLRPIQHYPDHGVQLQEFRKLHI